MHVGGLSENKSRGEKEEGGAKRLTHDRIQTRQSPSIAPSLRQHAQDRKSENASMPAIPHPPTHERYCTMVTR